LQRLFPFSEIIPISALTGDGVSILIEQIWKLLPEGPRYFPDDVMTDRTERFIAAEIIREKIILFTHQEIPYTTAVVVD
jgi:GTP-binding protein Era